MPASRSADPHRVLSHKVVAVCGPTASGKSGLVDELARRISEACGSWATTMVVDSMQVYKGLPVITNQERSRPAEMVGFLPVSEDWNVARHCQKSEEVISALDPSLPFLLDAGTGMYLNALLLDIPLSPRAPDHIREKALRGSMTRREARKKELDLLGAPERGSIWEGQLRYDTTLIYLRPHKETLGKNIEERSARIASKGVDELGGLYRAGLIPNQSLSTSIGVQEITAHLSGGVTLQEAHRSIESRTRKLTNRQRRWFDKLVRSLPGEMSDPARMGDARTGANSARVTVLETPEDIDEHLTHSMHGIL